MYCTNCGQEIDGKLCKHCGVKNGRVPNFCRWCGEKLNSRASICTSCGEKLRPYKAVRIFSFIFLGVVSPAVALAMLFFLSAFWVGDKEEFFTGIAFLCGSILPAMVFLFVPSVHRAIKEAACKKGVVTRKRQKMATWFALLYVFCGLVLCFGIYLGSGFLLVVEKTPKQGQVQYEENEQEEESIEDRAVKAAKAVVQNALRNPGSMMVHKAEVNIVSFDTDTDIATYSVELDYSAQNGFGGMNRKTETVVLKYNFAERTFYSGSRKINIGS